MTSKNKLKNNLIRIIQSLPADKLEEVSRLLGKIENQINGKERTLNLAGTWINIDDDLFNDLTENLHNNRASERDF